MKQLYHPRRKEVDAFIFKVNVAANTTIVLPLTNENSSAFDCWVDWGDKTAKKYINSYSNADKSHLYVNAGIYTIRIAGKCQSFDIYNAGTIRDALIEVVEWGTRADFKRLRFYGCANLVSIPDKPMTSVSNILSCQDMYRSCTRLAMNIPVGLFDNAVSSSNFYGTFQNSGFTGTIPPYLFRYNVNVTVNGFCATFQGAVGLSGSIPSTLFETNILVSANGFNATFADTNLSGPVPYNLFWNNPLVSTGAFYRTFYSSENINGRVHPQLFLYNTLAQSFQETFAYTGVHGNVDPLLFTYANASVLSFNGTFRNTNMGWDDAGQPLEVLPDTIFDTNLNAVDFSYFVFTTKFNHPFPLLWQVAVRGKYFNYTFGSTPFTGIPSISMFSLCLDGEQFSGTFSGTLITDVPKELFWSNVKATHFSGTFAGCYSLSNNPNLGYPIYNNELFMYNPEVITFGQLFWDDYNIQCRLPEDMFWQNTKVRDMFGTFGKNYVKGLLPEKLLWYMPELTSVNYLFYWGGNSGGNSLICGEVPRDLFLNNTKINTLYMCFRWAYGLTRLPSGLLRNCDRIGDVQYMCQSNGYMKIDRYIWSESNDQSAYERFQGCFFMNAYQAFTGAGNSGREFFINLDVAPLTDWVDGDQIEGQTSHAKCEVIERITSLQYRVRNIRNSDDYYYPPTGSNPFTLGEVIGVTGNADKLADQGSTRPSVSTVSANTSYAAELWNPAIYDTHHVLMTAQPRPATLWQKGQTIKGMASGAQCVLKTEQSLVSWSFYIKNPTKAFSLGEIIGVEGDPGTLADQNSNMPTWQFASQYMILNVAPDTPWVCGDPITGLTSGAIAIIVGQRSALEYYIRGVTGTFADGETIGVTGDPARQATQNLGAPAWGYGMNSVAGFYGSLSSATWANFASIPASWK